MQTSLWNFLKKGITHKLVLRGMFRTCSEFLFLSHDDYRLIILMKSISFRYCAGISTKVVRFFCENNVGLELQQNVKKSFRKKRKKNLAQLFS